MAFSWSVNITPVERVTRVVLGLVGVVAGAFVLIEGATPWAMVLAGLLIVAGLDLVVTGATGHCPLYHKLGYVPASLEGVRRDRERST